MGCCSRRVRIVSCKPVKLNGTDRLLLWCSIMSRLPKKPRAVAARTTKQRATVSTVVRSTQSGQDTGGVSWQRLHQREMFEVVLRSDPIWETLSTADREKYVACFEKVCLNEAIRRTQGVTLSSFDHPYFVTVYSDVGYRLASAVMKTTHLGKRSLLSRIVDGEIKLGELGEATMHILDPDATRELREHIANRSKQKANIVVCTLYRCRKCGQNQTKKETFQARSGDEGECCIVTCLNCEAHWYIV